VFSVVRLIEPHGSTVAGSRDKAAKWERSRPSRCFDFGLIDQQNGNIIADGIEAAALAAFQASVISLDSQRLLADGANQNIE
jgi:hypothetical protein